MIRFKFIRTFAAAGLLLCVGSTWASSWNWASVGNDETRYFFDADTVEKTRETTTVWVKTVQVSKPDTDGSWSTALRWRFNCSKRTVQSLGWSIYDKDGKFIRSNSNPTSETAVVPDSTGEAMLKIACEANFPRDKSGERYFKLSSNDVFQATRNYAEILKSSEDIAPK
ncbi:surface-adhesin E family protein [Piscinibacter gummiphilus]|uniref:Surface-adhesin protein E-like domain-containing protein n=1 Tax=Piscinibacter gummiphilus TaxID=946333 RepID=A0ABZ0CV95_9BURK|nr:surface-adhesin E family protein [Piscinibacter gummiphilus]WOB06867.1 hypothetical protein RXV79_18315 [Piscinibacter gummiphilus]